MDARIEPEPTADERAAVLQALDRELEPASDPRGAWWRRGVAEALRQDPSDPIRAERP